MNQTIVPIVFSCDNNFARYTDVAIVSMLENAFENTFYDIYILVNANFSKKNQKQILKDCSKYKKNKVHFIKMDDVFKKYETGSKRFPASAYYRLIIANVLDKHDKCIYLDSDIIIKQDLSLLYNTDISEHYMAGVKIPGHYVKDKQEFYLEYAKEIELPNLNNYINSGVLVINLNKIRKENVVEKFLEYAEKKNFLDQDVINKVCYCNFKILELKYNLMTSELKHLEQDISKGFTQEEIKEALENPVIIHYVSAKPWKDKKVTYADIWWDYVYKTAYKNELFLNYFIRKISKKIFSVSNSKTHKHKIIYLLGFKISIKRKLKT